MISDSFQEKIIAQHSHQEVFQALFDTAVKINLPIAIWKLPCEEQWQTLIGDSISVIEKPEVESLGPGFIVNSFENKGTNKCFFIKGGIYFSSISNDLLDLSLKFNSNFKEELNKTLERPDNRRANKDYGQDPASVAEEKADDIFKSNVIQAVKEIEAGTFLKVVLARQKQIELSPDFSIIQTFERLSSIYLNSFTSLVFIPEMGIWMGASPETLISIKNNIFRTAALAGTQSGGDTNINLRDVAWTQKEIEEQALVSRYIINCFKKIRLREYNEEGPKTVRAGNLLHLRTDYSVNMKEVDFPLLGSMMLDLLHPTSAVCGMPHQDAFDFITAHEPFKRELYSGYLGPVNIQDTTCLFVNLRCMKLDGTKAVLFAGAGITVDSVPEKEWNETEIKFKTLLNVIPLIRQKT